MPSTHTHHSLYTCVFPVSSIMPEEKKKTWIRMYTQITCPDQGLIRRRHRTTLHTPRGLEALVSNTRKSPAMATRSCNFPGTVPLETCGHSDQRSVFNHGGGAVLWLERRESWCIKEQRNRWHLTPPSVCCPLVVSGTAAAPGPFTSACPPPYRRGLIGISNPTRLKL